MMAEENGKDNGVQGAKYGLIGNALELNRYMTNNPIAFSLQHVSMEVLWVSFPMRPEEDTKDGSRKTGLHSHSFCETHLCTHGELLFQLPDQPAITIHEGEAIYIRENVMHECTRLNAETMRISMAYRLSRDKSPSGYGVEKDKPYIMIIHDGTRLYELYKRISEELAAHRFGYEDMINTYLFQIGMIFERSVSANETVSKNLKRIDSRAEEILRYIENNQNRPMTAENVAEHLHISKRQLDRITRREYGVSCAGLILRIKHKRAQELLIHTDLSLQDITVELGYSSVFAFARFFKNIEGMPPAQFRKSHASY